MATMKPSDVEMKGVKSDSAGQNKKNLVGRGTREEARDKQAPQCMVLKAQSWR